MPDLTRNLAASRRIIIIHIMRRFFLYLIISLLPIFMSAQENVTAQDLVGRTFVYDNLVKKCSIEFLNSTTCVVTQQFTIPDFPKEYKYLQTKCKYCIKRDRLYSNLGQYDSVQWIEITKVLSPLPKYIKRKKIVELPEQCLKKLNAYVREPGKNSRFYPNGQPKEGICIDCRPVRTFAERDGFLRNPKGPFLGLQYGGEILSAMYGSLFLAGKDGIWVEMNDSTWSQNGELSSLAGKRYKSGDYLKEELYFANDSICIYTQECECLPNDRQRLVIECSYSCKDNILVLHNNNESVSNCFPVYQEPNLLSRCLRNYVNEGYRFPDYVLQSPTLFNIIRSDTLTVTPNGSLLYYKMLMPEGLDPMFIAREYKEDININESENRDANIVDYRQNGLDPMFIAREYKEDIITKESEDRDANIVDYRQRRIINY